MALLGQTSITLRRYTAGSRDANGEWVNGASSDTPILASVQVASGSDLQHLPEGERSRQTKKVYTENALGFQSADQYTGVKADELVIDSVSYEVQVTFPDHPLISHAKCLATRLQEVS